MITFEELTAWLLYQQLARKKGGAANMQDPVEGPPHPGPFLFSMRGIGMLFLSPLNRKMQMAFGLNPGTRAIMEGTGSRPPSRQRQRRMSDPELRMPSTDSPKRRKKRKRTAVDDMMLYGSPDTDESDTESDYDYEPIPRPISNKSTFVPLGVISPESGFVPIVINRETMEEHEQPFPNDPCAEPDTKQMVPVSSFSRIRAEHMGRGTGCGFSPFGRQYGSQSRGRNSFANMCSAVNDAFQKQKDRVPTSHPGRRPFGAPPQQNVFQQVNQRFMAGGQSKSSHPPQDLGGPLPKPASQAWAPLEPAHEPPNSLGLNLMSREESDSGFWDVLHGQESTVSTRESSPYMINSPAYETTHMTEKSSFQQSTPFRAGAPRGRLGAFGAMPGFGQGRMPGFRGMGSSPFMRSPFGTPGYRETAGLGQASPIDIPTQSSVVITEITGSPGSDTTLVGSQSSQGLMSAMEHEQPTTILRPMPDPEPPVMNGHVDPVPMEPPAATSKIEEISHERIEPVKQTPANTSPFRSPKKPGIMHGPLGFFQREEVVRERSEPVNQTPVNVPPVNAPPVNVPLNTGIAHGPLGVFQPPGAGRNSQERTLPPQEPDTEPATSGAEGLFKEAAQGVLLEVDEPAPPMESPSALVPYKDFVSHLETSAVVPLTHDLGLALPADKHGKASVAIDPSVAADMTVAVREAAGELAIPSSEPWVVCAAVPKGSDAAAVEKAVSKGALVAIPASQAASAMKDMESNTDMSFGSDSGGLSFRDEDTQTIADDDLSFYEMELQDYEKLSDWMSELPPRMHHVHLTGLAIPGSNITCAIEGDMQLKMDFSKCNLEMLDILRKLPDFAIFNDFRKRMKRIWKSWMPKQALSVYQQLEAGARYLDIQVAKYQKQYYGEHGLYTREFKVYLNQIVEFLDEHPKEVVILHFKKLNSYNRRDKRNLLTDLFAAFGRKLCSSVNMYKLTLSYMWQHKKQVIVIFPKADMEYFKGHIFDQFVFRESSLKMSELSKKQSVEDLVDHLDSEYARWMRTDKFSLLYAVLSPDLNMVFGDYQYSCMGDMSVRETAPNLCKWLHGKRKLNIVVLDFIGGGDVVKAVVELNHQKKVVTIV